MLSCRRRLLFIGFITMGATAFGIPSITAQNPNPIPPPRPHEPGTADESGNPPLPLAAGNKALLEQRQKDIKKDIEKLYDLVAGLKADIEKTDSTAVLSIGMVKKAEDVERLARQIKDLAKG